VDSASAGTRAQVHVHEYGGTGAEGPSCHGADRAARPLAIVNFSTEQYVNLVTPSDFELFNVAEAFAFAVLLVGAGLTGPTALLALTSVTGGYALMKWLLRQQRYRKTRRLVETENQQTAADPVRTLSN